MTYYKCRLLPQSGITCAHYLWHRDDIKNDEIKKTTNEAQNKEVIARRRVRQVDDMNDKEGWIRVSIK